MMTTGGSKHDMVYSETDDRNSYNGSNYMLFIITQILMVSQNTLLIHRLVL